MAEEVKLCPICLTENTGGRPHRYHKLAARKSGHTLEELAIAARATIEQNAIKAISRALGKIPPTSLAQISKGTANIIIQQLKEEQQAREES